ncbi:AAA family ATPase [Rhodocaloribacter litoris]|uniref:AAA family ATPase n=1 Tax=Rhodocaloribacter litoris TaxID=2558931 RepID=UPI0014207C44|nr:AAA family ATPase [Rhodocaloribacter litoris]QXD17023.1 AAA family ATPase [Rhodocaloribacter litoris]
MRLEDLLRRLHGVRPSGSGYAARCPAHEDREPSLSVSEGEGGRVLLYCHAGCSTEAVVEALGLTLADLMPAASGDGRRGREPAPPPIETARYTYRDEEGRPLYEVRRYQPKRFVQYRREGDRWVPGLGNTRRVLYRLPEVIEAARAGRVVCVVEGEKDADRLAALGFTATTCPGGAGKWRDEYSEALRGAHVVILPDNDEPGRRHAAEVARAVWGVARSVRVVELPGLPERGDVSDWLDAGHRPADLRRVIRETPPLEAPPETPPEPPERPQEARSHDTRALAVRVADVEREAIRWLWPGRLALGKLTILDGDPGLGKSTLYCDLAARITTGRPWPDAPDAPPGEPAAVVIVTCEDGIADTIRPRLEEAGADLSRVHVIQAVREGEDLTVPRLPDHIDAIEAVVQETGAALLVVDPIMAHLGDRINAHRDADVRRALTPLALLCERCGCAALVVRHLNKMTGGDPLYRGGGSIGIIGQARLGLLLASHPEHETADGVRVLATTKANVGAWRPSLVLRLESSEHDPDTGVIRWGGTTPLTARDLLARPKAERPRDEAADWLRERLASAADPVPARDLFAEAEARGISEKTLRRAKKGLGVVVEQVPPRPGGTWYWSLPGAGASHICSDNVFDVPEAPDGQFYKSGHLGDGADDEVPF